MQTTFYFGGDSPTLTAPVHPCTRGISTSLYVIQRGNNREPCFYAEEDYRRYLDDLQESAVKFDCRIHAFVLMTKYGISQMMLALGRRYVLVFPTNSGHLVYAHCA